MSLNPNQATTPELLTPESAIAYAQAATHVMTNTEEKIPGVFVHAKEIDQEYGTKAKASLSVQADHETTLKVSTNKWQWDDGTTDKIAFNQLVSENDRLTSKTIQRTRKRWTGDTEYTATGIRAGAAHVRFGTPKAISAADAKAYFATFGTDFKAALTEKLAGHPDLLDRIEQGTQDILTKTSPREYVEKVVSLRRGVKPRIATAIGKLATHKHER